MALVQNHLPFYPEDCSVTLDQIPNHVVSCLRWLVDCRLVTSGNPVFLVIRRERTINEEYFCCISNRCLRIYCLETFFAIYCHAKNIHQRQRGGFYCRHTWRSVYLDYGSLVFLTLKICQSITLI